MIISRSIQATSMNAPQAEPRIGVIDCLHRHAQSSPARLALCAVNEQGAPSEPWTWGRLAQSVDRLAHVLTKGGHSGGAVMAVWSDNAPELVAWLLAGVSAGARVLLLHPLLTAAEVEGLLKRSSARLLVAPLSRKSDVTHLPLALAADPGDHLSRDECSLDGGVILSSSGTTGLPKLACRGARSLYADGRNLASAMSLSADDRVLAAVPLSHSYGIDLIMASLVAGASLHIRAGGFEGGALRACLASGAVTVVPGVPLMFAGLIRDSGSAQVRDVRLAFSAGSPIPQRVALEVQQHWGIELGHLYGATELGTVAFGNPADPRFSPESVGLPLDGVEFRVVEPGNPALGLVKGDEGELAVRAPSMLSEYLDGRVPLVDGFFLTGDLGYLDELGRVFVTGRLKHLIDVGGMKVNPAEVEAVYERHPAIAECAAAALPLSDVVTKLRLLYVPRVPGDECDPSDLRAFARDRLAPFKRPRTFEPVAALPRSASGKLLRHLLHAL